jgi:transcription initiation factor IIE alpha subunit
MYQLTEEEYEEHIDSCDGFCTECGEVKYSFTEPDAENYPCEACGKNAVVGFELALIIGLIDFTDL